LLERDDAAERATAFAADRLPPHMVPAVVVALDELPTGPSGKVDRAALRRLEPAAPPPGDTRPGTAAERLVAGIWAEVLGRDRLPVAANFFELGGHSLAAMQVMSRLRAATGLDLPVRLVFEAPTVAEFARRAGLDDAPASRRETELETVSRDGELPLSFGQERVWNLDRLQPGGTFFNCVIPLRLRGDLDEVALRRAFDALVERHEVLRTTYESRDGRAVPRIRDSARVPLTRTDLGALDRAAREDAVREAIADETSTPMTLHSLPMLRARLLALSAGEHVLIVTFHHVVMDDWTDAVLAAEFAELYRAFAEGVSHGLPEPAVQYADFASWQRRRLSGGALEEGVADWRRVLDGVAFDSDPPADRRPPDPPTYRARTVRARLAAGTSARLRGDWAGRGVTPFMALLAAYQILLSAESDSTDVCVESPMANRGHWQIERMVGYTVNPVLLRTDLSGDPHWSQVLDRVREVCLHAFARQDVPFASVAESLIGVRNLYRHPVAKFILLNGPTATPGLPGLSVEVIDSPISPQSKNRYVMNVAEREGEFETVLLYNTDQIDEEHARRALAAYTSILAEIAVTDPRVSDLVDRARDALAGRAAVTP
ncbi:condensation domain-containing protein, partial [Actinoallomurus acaciae]